MIWNADPLPVVASVLKHLFNIQQVFVTLNVSLYESSSPSRNKHPTVTTFCRLQSAYSRFVLTAPNVLRVESEEIIVLEAHGFTGVIDAEIRVLEFPSKRHILHSIDGADNKVQLNANNQYHATKAVKISASHFKTNSRGNQFVYLQAISPFFTLEKIIVVSSHVGYVFLQTDKPVYNPGDTGLQAHHLKRFASSSSLNKSMKNDDYDQWKDPDGLVVYRDILLNRGTYQLHPTVKVGVWKLVAKFADTPQKTYTSEFEVKEYGKVVSPLYSAVGSHSLTNTFFHLTNAQLSEEKEEDKTAERPPERALSLTWIVSLTSSVLPSFEVKLEPSQAFFYVDDNELSVDVTATYFHGNEVEGYACVVFGLLVDNKRRSFTDSLQRIEIKNGRGTARLTRQQILRVFRDISQLIDQSIYVSATVLTPSGSDMAEAEMRGIKVVTSRYEVLFTRTPKYFMPGFPFDVMVLVTNPDGSPASNVGLEGQPGNIPVRTNRDGTAKMVFNTVQNGKNLVVTVRTNSPLLAESRQAEGRMEAVPYQTQSNSNNYLHIHISSAQVSAGTHLQINMNIQTSDVLTRETIQYISYLITNKGSLIKAGRQQRQRGQSFISLWLPVEREMIPSFRFVAYYYVTTGGTKEIVSDSIWVDVEDSCIGTLQVIPGRDGPTYGPHKFFSFKIRGDPGAMVGLVAVDKAMFVSNNKNKLTQTKIWDLIEKNDIGCTPGRGQNSMGVFSDAGLIFESNVNIGTPSREDPDCPVPPKRNRRSVPGRSRRARCAMTLPLYFKLLKFFDISSSSDRMDGPNGWVSRSAFQNVIGHKARELVQEDPPVGYSGRIPAIPVHSLVENEVRSFTKESITTWVILAVSLSSKGICVADPYEITVKKDFFIDLRLPYSVVRNEQVEIKAVLYNSYEEDIEFRVEWTTNKQLCSKATKNKHYETVRITRRSSRAVSFFIIPLRLGRIVIEVKALGRNHKELVADGVKKQLNVVPEGMLVKKINRIIVLDPSKSGKAMQRETPENAINASRLIHLIRRGYGPAEMIMMAMTKTVIVTHYLDKSNQWDRVGVSWRAQAIDYITGVETSGPPAVQWSPLSCFLTSGRVTDHLLQWSVWMLSPCSRMLAPEVQGKVKTNRHHSIAFRWHISGISDGTIPGAGDYIQELSFRKTDGSFGTWITHPSSTWLTAYVVKVFTVADTITAVDHLVICGAFRWLILNKQQPDGVFREDSPTLYGDMVGGQRNSESDVTLTAFVLIALAESGDHCRSQVQAFDASIEKAAAFLDRRLPTLQKPYTVAISSYALALCGRSHHDSVLMKSASPDGTHWDGGSHLFTLEATGYALLASVKTGQYDRAGKIVRWLTGQEVYGGGSESTQATTIVFQAITEYLTNVPGQQDIDLDVDLTGHSRPVRWRFSMENANLSRSTMVSTGQDVSVTAKGNGQRTLSVTDIYYALMEQKTTCKKFDLEVTMTEVPSVQAPEGALRTFILTIRTKYHGERDATMSILDVSMLTGFIADQTDLQKLASAADRNIQKVEVDKVLSNKASLILYLDKVSNKHSEVISIKVHEMFKVGSIQPAAVTIYEYYESDNRCQRFYNPEEKSGLLSKICYEDECRCAEAYHARLLEVTEKSNYVLYNMEIVKVILEGNLEKPEGQKRRFFSPDSCKKTLNLEANKDYVIAGNKEDWWHSSSEFVLTAPNVIRVESEENIVLEAHDFAGVIDAEIRVLDFPGKKQTLYPTDGADNKVQLSANNQYHVTKAIKPLNIPAIVAPTVICGCLVILVIFLIVFFKVRQKRRLEGTYRPREEETEGTQKQPPSNLKLPPEERLI
ncbi:VCO3 factor, partial [Polypterus senegalus]